MSRILKNKSDKISLLNYQIWSSVRSGLGSFNEASPQCLHTASNTSSQNILHNSCITISLKDVERAIYFSSFSCICTPKLISFFSTGQKLTLNQLPRVLSTLKVASRKYLIEGKNKYFFTYDILILSYNSFARQASKILIKIFRYELVKYSKQTFSTG